MSIEKAVESKIIFFMGILVLLGGSVIIKFAVKSYSSMNGIEFLLLFILGCIVASTGAILLKYAKKLKAVNAIELLKNDQRPPVLYLRSFRDDQVGKKMQYSPILNHLSFAFTIVPQNLNTEEEQMEIAFRSLGPMICLGKPGESLPELGAARQYVPDEKWKETIKEFCEISSLILIRGGETRSLEWEINYVMESGYQDKVVFLLPNDREKLNKFNELLMKITKMKMPVYNNITAGDRFSGLLYFDKNEGPVFIEIKGNTWRNGNDIAIKLKRTFDELPVHFFPKYSNKVALDRLKAFLLDLKPMFYVCLLPAVGLAIYWKDISAGLWLLFLGSLLLGLLFNIAGDFSSSRATRGKKKFHLKMMDKSQVDPSFNQILMRNMAKYLTVIFIIVDVFIFWGTDNHIHDYLSGTRVYRIK